MAPKSKPKSNTKEAPTPRVEVKPKEEATSKKSSLRTRGESDPTANRYSEQPENIFSDDEDEKTFIAEVCRVKERAWVLSHMKWNAIHGIPWKRCDVLGRGTFGSVYLGMRKDNKLFAVKSINIEYPTTARTTYNIKCQISEIQMMKFMRSKYIVRALGCGRSKGVNGMGGGETLDVFLEYVIRGSLKHVAKARKTTFEETPYVKQYTYDILKALQYMQKLRIVHGDIKMSNLLLSDNCVKLADWGGAKQLTNDNLGHILSGTFGFRSPEVVHKEQQSYPADIFSLGCTVIEMIIGRAPYDVLKKDVSWDAPDLDFTPEIPQKAGPELQDFLSLCLCKDLKDRWTAAELLHHPFITNRDPDNILPYDMPVPRLINLSLLEPPRRNDPELPNERMTRRVLQHLSGTHDVNLWVPNMMGCSIDVPPPIPPSPQPPPGEPLQPTAIPSQAPAPLPPFLPDLTIKEGTKLDNDLLQALCNEGAEVVAAPTSPPRSIYHVNLKKGWGGGDTDRLTEFKDAKDTLQRPRVKWNPLVMVKEFKASLREHTDLMDEFNKDIYAEARRAYMEELPGDSDEEEIDKDGGSKSLFPHLAPSKSRREDPNNNAPGSPRRLSYLDRDNNSKSRRRDPNSNFLPGSSKRPSFLERSNHSRMAKLGCAGDLAVDVAAPENTHSTKVKKEK
ncbi:unnamed protein product [Calypogeia fissa]